jgi:hypothetical protein
MESFIWQSLMKVFGAWSADFFQSAKNVLQAVYVLWQAELRVGRTNP